MLCFVYIYYGVASPIGGDSWACGAPQPTHEAHQKLYPQRIRKSKIVENQNQYNDGNKH